MPKSYSKEFRNRAVRMVRGAVDTGESLNSARLRIARSLGIGSETLRRWLAQAEIDEGQRHGMTAEEREEIKALRRENAELRRANEILKAASAFFVAEPGRPRA